MSSISFRRATRSDFALIAGWLAEPHVARWWNHEFTAEAVERDFGAPADGEEPSEDHIALLEGRPIGLIQYSHYSDYPEYKDELAALLSVPDHAVSIDYLIGDPAIIGTGVGSAMLCEFVARIWQVDPEVECIVVPVNAANEPSWRVLLSIGFDVVATGELKPDNPIDDPLHKVLRIDRACLIG